MGLKRDFYIVDSYIHGDVLTITQWAKVQVFRSMQYFAQSLHEAGPILAE